MTADPGQPATFTDGYAELISRALEGHLRDRQQSLFRRQHRLCFKFGRCVLHSPAHQFDCPVEKFRTRGIAIQPDGNVEFEPSSP